MKISQCCVPGVHQSSVAAVRDWSGTGLGHDHESPPSTLHTQIWTLVAKPRLFFDTPPNAVETTNRI